MRQVSFGNDVHVGPAPADELKWGKPRQGASARRLSDRQMAQDWQSLNNGARYLSSSEAGQARGNQLRSSNQHSLELFRVPVLLDAEMVELAIGHAAGHAGCGSGSPRALERMVAVWNYVHEVGELKLARNKSTPYTARMVALGDDKIDWNRPLPAKLGNHGVLCICAISVALCLRRISSANRRGGGATSSAST